LISHGVAKELSNPKHIIFGITFRNQSMLKQIIAKLAKLQLVVMT